MDAGKVLVGVLAGVAVGAALGILFAPHKGSDTRRRMTEAGNDYVEDLEDKFNKLIDGITKQFETALEENFKMAKNGKAKVDESIANIKDTL